MNGEQVTRRMWPMVLPCQWGNPDKPQAEILEYEAGVLSTARRLRYTVSVLRLKGGLGNIMVIAVPSGILRRVVW